MTHLPNKCPMNDCGGELELVGVDKELGYEVYVCKKCYQQATKIGTTWWPCRFHLPHDLKMEIVR